jgi:hypothetical protein
MGACDAFYRRFAKLIKSAVCLICKSSSISQELPCGLYESALLPTLVPPLPRESGRLDSNQRPSAPKSAKKLRLRPAEAVSGGHNGQIDT